MRNFDFENNKDQIFTFFFHFFHQNALVTMRKYTIATVLFLMLFMVSACSSVYQTSGGTTITPRRNFLNGAKIDLIVFDVRPDKHKGIEIERTIKEHITRSYPRAWVRLRDKNAFFKEPTKGVITLKLKIDEYELTKRYVNTNGNLPLSNSGFSAIHENRVNAIMTLLPTIYDYRKDVNTKKTTHLTEAYPIDLRNDGGFTADGMGIVFQKNLDRLCNFIDTNLE